MSYLIENGLRVRFCLDHHFLQQYLEISSEEKKESIMHKIMNLANRLNELDVPCLLFAGERIIKVAEELIEGKTGIYALKRHLLRFLVNSISDGDTPNVILSVWRSTSKVGFKNYLITPSEELKKRFKVMGCSFEIIEPDEAYHFIIDLAKKQKDPKILD